MSLLFTPLQLKSIRLKNRLVMSPMCQYSSQDGFANEWHYVHYGSRAVGGAGLILFEATAVSPEGRISPDDLGIWDDEHIGKLKWINDFIHEQGAVPGIQLAHAGRKASISSEWKGNKTVLPEDGGWRPVAPSPLPFTENHETPQELNHTGIRKVLDNFAAATDRALRAGFQVIEIHAAHGYLLHEFMSPLTNHRQDEYGGSHQNRTRLLSEVVDAVRSVTKEVVPVFVRISATDWVEGGWDLDESVQLARTLKAKGVDLIDVSSGGLTHDAKIQAGPGYQVPFARTIRKEAEIATGAVGLITEAQQAEFILENGDADLVLMGREFLRCPYKGIRSAEELGADTEGPLQYERAKKRK